MSGSCQIQQAASVKRAPLEAKWAHPVCLIRTGTANLASVAAGFLRCGAQITMADSPAAVLAAHRLVLPGVGTFGAGMRALVQQGLVDALRERFARGLPTLAVCVGMQLLCKTSQESPGVQGLGILDAQVTQFSSQVRVPQLGWNKVSPKQGCRLVQPGYAYFANSYRLCQAPAGWSVATTSHDTEFVSALERDGILGCQFHPELSGPWGQTLLSSWLQDTQAKRSQSDRV